MLGIPDLFSAGYGNVGSSIYYALGIVALVALGATPIALAAAGITQTSRQPGSLRLLDAMVNRQAAMLAYNRIFFFLALLFIFSLPLIVLLKKEKQSH